MAQANSATSKDSQTRDGTPLVRLLAALARREYQFRTVTPTTHRRVITRDQAMLERVAESAELRDIFGWNLPFALDALPADIVQPMREAGVLSMAGGMASSRLRVASLGSDLFLHSCFPTVDPDAVFFGPDTYRFARFLSSVLKCMPVDEVSPSALSPRPMRVLDIGCGSGVGGIVAARAIRSKGIPVELILSDINPQALILAAANARAAGLDVTCTLGDTLSAVTGNFDLIVSNPPYLDDDVGRLYRHGGERLGRALSVRIAAESVARLTDGGRLLLYTGVAMVDAQDPFITELMPVLDVTGCTWTYDEIDPDVFGEELERPVYAKAHRIAAVGLAAHRRCGDDLAF